MPSGFVPLAGRFHDAYVADRMATAEKAGLRRKRHTGVRERVGQGLIALGERLVQQAKPERLSLDDAA